MAETQPRAEVPAQFNLERQGFDCFCPRFRKTRRHARRVDQVLAPVFPGYVFIRFDHRRDHWRAINGTTGIRRLIGNAQGIPHPVPSGAMAALLARCDSGVMQCIMPSLEVGQKVKLANGPFMNVLATIDRLEDSGRVRVLLSLLGGQIPAQVARGDLAPA